MAPRAQAGFTLVELMTVTVTLGILAMIAIPTYADHVRRSRVAEALSVLLAQQVRMEKYFQDNGSYVGACSTETATIAPPPGNTAAFSFSCGAPAAATYTLTATGLDGTPVAGFGYTVSQNGARTSVMEQRAAWPSSASCWVLRKDGSC